MDLVSGTVATMARAGSGLSRTAQARLGSGREPTQIGFRSRMPNCRNCSDLYDHFASNDPKWHPEVAEMLLTVRALALN